MTPVFFALAALAAAAAWGADRGPAPPPDVAARASAAVSGESPSTRDVAPPGSRPETLVVASPPFRCGPAETCVALAATDAEGVVLGALDPAWIAVETPTRTFGAAQGLRIDGPGALPPVAVYLDPRLGNSLAAALADGLVDRGFAAMVLPAGRPTPRPPAGVATVRVSLAGGPAAADPFAWSRIEVDLASGLSESRRVLPGPGLRLALALSRDSLVEGLAGDLAPLARAFRARVPAALPDGAPVAVRRVEPGARPLAITPAGPAPPPAISPAPAARSDPRFFRTRWAAASVLGAFLLVSGRRLRADPAPRGGGR